MTRPALLTLILVAAAFPFRFAYGLPVFGSLSLLDVVLAFGALVLLWNVLRTRRLDLGHPRIAALLAVPLVASVASLLWTREVETTVSWIAAYLEGLVAFLLVVHLAERMSESAVIWHMQRFVYLLLIPPVLMLLRVPGFSPELPGYTTTSADYVSYYTRLSHPFIGRSNNIATVLAFFVLILLHRGAARRDLRATAAGLVALVAVVLTLSRGVMLSLVCAGGIYVFLRARHASETLRPLGWRPVVLLSVCVSAVMAFTVTNPVAGEFFQSRFDVVNVVDRLDRVDTAIGYVQDRPALGYGAGVNPSIEGRLDAGVHNTYIQQVIYFGLPLGAVVIASLMLLPVTFLFGRMPRTVGVPVGLSLVVLLLTFATQSSYEGTLLRVVIYLSIGLGVAFARAAVRAPHLVLVSDEAEVHHVS